MNDYVEGDRPGWPLIVSAALTSLLMAEWWDIFGMNRFWIGLTAGLAIGFLGMALTIAPRRIPVQVRINDRRSDDRRGPQDG